MRVAPLLSLAFLLSALSFAGTLEECMVSEESCMHSCCTQAGGQVEGTVEEGLKCMGNLEDMEAASAAYNSCIYGYCRPTAIECVAPSAQCSSSYQACFNSCALAGAAPEACDENCFGGATECMFGYLDAQENAGTGCCGSAFILAFSLLGAFTLARR